MASKLLNENDFIFRRDLTSAYHQIETFKELQQYKRFSWLFKALREVVEYLRSQGKRIIMFLDEGMVGKTKFCHCFTVY